MAPKRRRDDKVGPFAGIYSTKRTGMAFLALGISDELHLVALGIPCELVEDPGGEAAAALERGLLPWSLQPDVLLDRFDARLLLHDLPAAAGSDAARSKLLSEAEEAGESELDVERYADLNEGIERHSPAASGEGESEEDGGSAGELERAGDDAGRAAFRAVGLSYGDAAEPAEAAAGDELELYRPRLEVPAHLANLLHGVTEHSHKVMLNTARFVGEAGQQAELVLRVRQATNPHFAFLKPDTPLHAYFRWLLRAQPQERDEPDEAPDEGAMNASDGLGQLLREYGSHETDAPADAAAGAAGADSVASEGRAPDAEGQESTPAADACGAAAAEPRRAGGVRGLPDQDAAAKEPPADVAAVVGKIVAYVQKNGVRFEAVLRRRERGNPRFGFLDPGDRHHWFYREKLLEALGPDQAQKVFAAMPEPAAAELDSQGISAAVPAPNAAAAAAAAAEQPAVNAATPAPQPAAQPAAAPAAAKPWQAGAEKPPGAHFIAIRANPSVAKIAMARRQPAGEQPTGQAPEQEPEEPPAEQASQAAAYAAAGADGAADTQGPASSAPNGTAAAEGAKTLQEVEAESARLSDAARKAQRRRLAQQLLSTRTGPAAPAAAAQPPSNAPAAAIAHHRLALLSEEDADVSTAAPGDGGRRAGEAAGAKIGTEVAGAADVTGMPAAAAAAVAAAVRLPAAGLPKLEELLRPRVVRSPSPAMSEAPSSSSSSAGGASRGHHRRRHRERDREKRRSRERRRTDDASRRSRQRRRSRSGSRSRGSRERERKRKRREDGGGRADRGADEGGGGPKRRCGEQQGAPRRQHDWGNARPAGSGAPEAAAVAGAEAAAAAPRPGAPVEVPDALRARIKAMLGRS